MNVNAISVESLYTAVIWATAIILVLSFFFAVTIAYLRRRNELRELRRSELEERWEGLLLRAISGEADTGEISRSVSSRDRLYFVEYLTRFGRRLRGRELEVLCEIAGPYLNEIVDRTTSLDTERRARAVQTLGVLGKGDYRSQLAKALDDSAPLVSMTAAWSIMRRPDEKSLRAVVARLEQFENWSPSFLASMLATVGPAIGPPLREALADPERPAWVRVTCADALRRLYDIRAAEVAAHVLRDQLEVYEAPAPSQPRRPDEMFPDIVSQRDLPVACLRLIRDLGRDEHLPLARRLSTHADFMIRAEAYSTIGSMGGADDEESLRGGIGDQNPWVALHAARALHRIAGKSELKRLADSRHPRAALAQQVLEEAVG